MSSLGKDGAGGLLGGEKRDGDGEEALLGGGMGGVFGQSEITCSFDSGRSVEVCAITLEAPSEFSFVLGF